MRLLFIIFCFIPGYLHAMHVEGSVPVVRHLNEHKRIDLNQASANQIVHAFKGLGEKRALAIVEWRDAHHGFKSLDDLRQVKGFGPMFMKHHARQIKRAFVVHTRGIHE